jgi:sulfur-carrier protein
MPLVHIPALLLSLTGGVRQEQVSGKTVKDLIEQLDKLHPGIRERLLEGDSLRSGLAVFVDGLVRREGLDFEVSPESEVHFIPAVAGGTEPSAVSHEPNAKQASFLGDG